jgi:hypothetical protein
LNRDYSINLLPEEDPRMIVWELLRPIQQTLPALLDEWELEFQKCCRHNDINSASHDLKTAKQFCKIIAQKQQWELQLEESLGPKVAIIDEQQVEVVQVLLGQQERYLYSC